MRVAEMFAGVGGFRLALEGYGEPGDAFYMPPAGDFETVWANQWEPPGTEGKQFAWKCYEERFGAGSCVNEDIEAVLDQYEAGEMEIPDFDMLVGGFPCFPAGTPVLTRRGYRPIESVDVGDEVLTHEGRFKRVVKRGYKKDAPLVEVRAMGSLPIKCTPNHPFMVREIERRIVGGNRVSIFGPLIEKAASDLKPSVDFIMYPRLTDGVTNTDMTEEEAWLVGRYVADGHLDTRHRQGRKNSFNKKVIFSIGKDKADEFASKLSEYHATRHEHTQSVERFIITSERLIVLIIQFAFGEGASNKNFTVDAIQLPKNLAAAMLDGYESGDGCAIKGNRQATTVSPDLARTLALLIQRVNGNVPMISKFERQSTCVIQGRTVNQQDTYTVRYKAGTYKHKQFHEVDGAMYMPVRSVTELDERAWVYNFEVEDDHTYVVENLVVHNCQDYSVSKPAPMAKGIEGKKGVLWWSIQRMVELKRPKYVLLENVDRLLKSPTAQRGRDFAIMLTCLAQMGYAAEWMVVNAADYGMPQRRRRVYVLASTDWAAVRLGTVQNALPFELEGRPSEFDLPDDPYETSKSFGDPKKSPFLKYGRMVDGHVWTSDVEPSYEGPKTTLGDVLVPDSEVPGEFFIGSESLERWEYLKGAKKEPRRARNGFEYLYSEGPVAFPDPLDRPARTILTGEGGKSPSRMKIVVKGDSGRLRRLVPDELDAIQMFPKGWTRGMSDNRRAFCMGNALVVGIPHRIGLEIARLDA